MNAIGVKGLVTSMDSILEIKDYEVLKREGESTFG
jgi:hypothetical protein